MSSTGPPATRGLVLRGVEDADGWVVYSLTPRGQQEVDDWFASPVVLNNPPRNELAIKIAIPGVDVTQLVQTQRRASMQALQAHARARRQVEADDLAGQLVVESLSTRSGPSALDPSELVRNHRE